MFLRDDVAAGGVFVIDASSGTLDSFDIIGMSSAKNMPKSSMSAQMAFERTG